MKPYQEPLPSNPETGMKHQQQFWIQIMLPIILGAALMIAAGVLASTEPGDRPAVWADISVILIVIMMFGIGVGIFVLIGIGIFGSDWLLKKLPYYSYIVQIYISYYGKKIREASATSAQPVLTTRSVFAGLKRIFNLRTTPENPSREE